VVHVRSLGELLSALPRRGARTCGCLEPLDKRGLHSGSFFSRGGVRLRLPSSGGLFVFPRSCPGRALPEAALVAFRATIHFVRFSLCLSCGGTVILLWPPEPMNLGLYEPCGGVCASTKCPSCHLLGLWRWGGCPGRTGKRVQGGFEVFSGGSPACRRRLQALEVRLVSSKAMRAEISVCASFVLAGQVGCTVAHCWVHTLDRGGRRGYSPSPDFHIWVEFSPVLCRSMN